MIGKSSARGLFDVQSESREVAKSEQRTCGSAVRSNVEFVTRPGLCDGELVILSVGRLPAVLQVHPQLIVARVGDAVEVGET